MVSKKLKDGFKAVMSSDKQRLTTYLAYIGIIGISIFSSFLSVIFGIEHFDSSRFITNLAFNIAIAVLGLVLAWKDGELSNQTRKTGTLFDIRQKFDKSVKIIVDHDSFRQWTDVFYETKRRSYIMNLLSRIGIYEYEYLLISEKDLERLKTEPLENVKYREKGKEYTIALDDITEVQYYKLLRLRHSQIKYEKLPFTFFLSRETEDEYQVYAKEQEHNKKEKVLALTYRIGSLVMLSVIIALSVVNPTESKADQVLFDTIGRIFQLFASMFMGYTIAHDEGEREIKCLEYKCRIIELYDNDTQTGLFAPKNRDELIKEKIAELRDKKMRDNDIHLGESEVIEIDEEDYIKMMAEKNIEK